jgi:hypothetical protein
MPDAVDFNTVATVGLESSPVAAALSGLRAHEVRTSRTGTTTSSRWSLPATPRRPPTGCAESLKEERDIVISSRPLEATAFQGETIPIAYVFYESDPGQCLWTRRVQASGAGCPR